ncbi:MAG: patatin-like phospholipase family protein [Myxacorys californica WJT36-NPBG1]|jgi:patatin-like phospholipase/acyl hydrolase|nr:patatin-like phospholipase family protein [Myxacorys californica WJT36-NPBG1]
MSYKILCLSGGGVRGLITAIWLQRLEQKLGRPIAEHFDLIAGTSTGALIACALASGIPATAIVELYRTRAGGIFPVPRAWWLNRLWRFLRQFFRPRYDGKGLERVLRDVFGDRRFGDLNVPTLITSYNLQTREALVFKTIKGRAEKYNRIPIWEICKASASAPVYFPAHITDIEGQRVPLIDGGVVANNPAACAIAEGARIFQEQQDSELAGDNLRGLNSFIVASFGTGDVARPISRYESQTWGAIGWVLPIINVLFDGSADAVDYISRQLLSTTNYFRFQTKLPPAFDDLDRSDDVHLNALIRVAEDYLAREGDALLDQLVAKLR